MKNDDAINQLRNLIDLSELGEAIEVAGLRAVALIDEHTRRGEFLGGSRAGQGYSEKPLPAGFMIRPTYVPGEGWKTGSIQIPQSDMQWSTNSAGERRAYLIGGYKKLRDIWGRNTNTVDLTFTGAMLRSLNATVQSSGGESWVVEITVSPDQMAKAAGTNSQREWMALTDEEADKIAVIIESGVKF
jgi:hypothetical protein